MYKSILNKYPPILPRYTSYPPAPFFNSLFSANDYLQAIEQSNHQQPQNISIYIHIPFCVKLCHYCGCNAQPMAKPDIVAAYIKAVVTELELVLSYLSSSRKIAQIHFGGGTPTALPVSALQQIMTPLNRFSRIDQAEIAIECHPAQLDLSYLNALHQAGFNRLSIGVQDFDPRVLKGVNRSPAKLPFSELVSYVKTDMKANLNLDFIYGLPLQTPESFLECIQKAISLQPDRLVCFPYAHVPQMFKRQVILEQRGLPDSVSKQAMFDQVCSYIAETKLYQKIGIDHFVLPTDELWRAKQTKQLHRNFQGYCSRQTTGQVYAFGVSGISQLAGCYAQNTKDIIQYITAIEQNVLPIKRGYQLTKDQEIQRDMINSLMCNYSINWTELSVQYRCTVPQLMAYVHKAKLFKELEDRGYLYQQNDCLVVTTKGETFVRLIAACFDPLLDAKLLTELD